jgi:hypothetical protein
MKSRRPELFSDSTEVQKNTLPRTHLEYELEYITSHSKEKNFEYFCRKICEKEIAPNLIPQTGPTGGGDSKADTETYPVTKEIAQIWYTHEALQSATERWAFAFSAKKDWRPKVKSDVAGIVGTGRNYQRIYFVSNQFIKDKDRAVLEDELSKAHSTSVRILSREWLVEKVYSNNYLDIAILTLDIQGYSTTANKVLGANDYKRTQELEELENNIKDASRYTGVTWQLADDCLAAANLVRELGKSKDEILNAFFRAKRIAEDHNLNYHLFKINYHLAWTYFFWFDDVKELLKIYADIEKYCEITNQIDDIEKLNNLFSLIVGQFHQGNISEEESGFTVKEKFLHKRLEFFIKQKDRPATSLYAKTLLTIINLIHSRNLENVASTNESFVRILNETDGLIDYPLQRTLNCLKEMQDVLSQSSNYEELFECIVKKTQKLESDVAAGDLIFERARKAYLGKEYNEAIRLFGKSIIYFAKDEYLEELILSLYGIADCYKVQGLFWAARNSYIAAIERSLFIFYNQRKIIPRIPWLIKNLIELEIQLGRPIHVIHWMELMNAILANYQFDGEDKEKEFFGDLTIQDVINAILILKTDFKRLESLQLLPDLYRHVEMPFSQAAAIYALGDYDLILREKMLGVENNTKGKVDDFISLWRRQPASRQIATSPEFADQSVVRLTSRLLSVDLNIFSDNNTSTIALAEMILSVSESMWATAMEERIYPHKASFNVYIQQAKTKTDELIFSCKSEIKDGETTLVIEHNGFNLSNFKKIDEREKLKKKLFEASAMIFANIAYLDEGTILNKIFGNESAISRSTAFADLHIALSSVFGDDHSFTLDRWIKNSSKIKKYEILRLSALENIEPFPIDSEEVEKGTAEEAADEILRRGKGKHGAQQINSLIDMELWNKSKWKGTGVMLSLELPPQFPPYLILVFEDYESAKEIFTGLKKKVGAYDKDGKIRLVIVKGIDKNNPYAYSVVFGSNILPSASKEKIFLNVSRINRMYPKSPDNLVNFEKVYKLTKLCYLAPGSIHNLEPEGEYAIRLKEVVIRNAWEIGENDMDIIGLPEDCEPLVPEGIVNPPYLKSLRYRKKDS